MYSCEKTSAMILDVFDVVMFTNIGGKGWVKKIQMLGATNVGRTNVGAYKRWASSEAIRGFGSFCYKRWVLQTLGATNVGPLRGHSWFWFVLLQTLGATNVGPLRGQVFHGDKRVYLQTLGLSEARYFMGINVFIYKRWASPRPGILWGGSQIYPKIC